MRTAREVIVTYLDLVVNCTNLGFHSEITGGFQVVLGALGGVSGTFQGDAEAFEEVLGAFL